MKKFMVVLAVLTVGTVQLFGAHIGYLCGCTGDFSQDAVCQPTACHSTNGQNEAKQAESAPHDPASSCGGQHQHNEVRDTLPMMAALVLSTLPAPVFFELPEAFQMCKFEVIEVDQLSRWTWLRPADDRSPTAAALVAGTVVLMV